MNDSFFRSNMKIQIFYCIDCSFFICYNRNMSFYILFAQEKGYLNAKNRY